MHTKAYWKIRKNKSNFYKILRNLNEKSNRFQQISKQTFLITFFELFWFAKHAQIKFKHLFYKISFLNI